MTRLPAGSGQPAPQFCGACGRQVNAYIPSGLQVAFPRKHKRPSKVWCDGHLTPAVDTPPDEAAIAAERTRVAATAPTRTSAAGWSPEEARQHTLVERLRERCATFAGGTTCPERGLARDAWCERCLAADLLAGPRHARVADDLLLTDALTGNHDGTPEHYVIDADNVDYLVGTVRALLGDLEEDPAPAAPALRGDDSEDDPEAGPAPQRRATPDPADRLTKDDLRTLRRLAVAKRCELRCRWETTSNVLTAYDTIIRKLDRCILSPKQAPVPGMAGGDQASALAHRVTLALHGHAAEWRGDATVGRVRWVCVGGDWAGDDYQEWRDHVTSIICSPAFAAATVREEWRIIYPRGVIADGYDYDVTGAVGTEDAERIEHRSVTTTESAWETVWTAPADAAASTGESGVDATTDAREQTA